ncbi:MAG TPA: amidohydrolase family protein, partial [Rectinemataceae bacterium]|nr:amidohydrolase family protein [Rectinemataceae bacterium]
VARQPRTLFIGAHVGCCAENLERVGRLLLACPNYYVDIAARIGELGRQPYSARRFFLRFQNRILFGGDFGPNPAAYRISYRFLETWDEYFNYALADTPDQGRWSIYGLGLPDETLLAVYRDNARRLFGFGGSA